MKKRLSVFTLLCVLISLAVPSHASLKTHLPKETVMRIVAEEALDVGIDPKLALAVAHVESNFSTHALSSAGARGVMQIMPATAREEFGVSPERLYNPRLNARLGSLFIKQLLDTYGGRLDIALSHYNGGSRVRLGNGQLRVIPATRQYVNKVLANIETYSDHPLLAAMHAEPTQESYWVASLGQQRAAMVAELRKLQDKNKLSRQRSQRAKARVKDLTKRPILDDFEDPNSLINYYRVF